MRVDSFKHECVELGITLTEIRPNYDLQEIQNSKSDDNDEDS